MRLPLRWAVPTLLVLFAARDAGAHFLWLKVDAKSPQAQAVPFFGESASDEAYHLPESLADTKIWCRSPRGDRIELNSEYVETDDRIGLVAPLADAKLPAGRPWTLEATRQYGVYGDFLLTYYAKHIHTAANEELAAAGPSPELTLDVVPKVVDGGLEITALWKGQPRADVEVNVSVGDAEPTKLKTGADGKVALQPEGEGLVAVLANFYDKTKNGELDGDKYTSAAHYATLTFPWRKEPAAKPQAAPAAVPALPEAVSSFGAAVSDGWLYVYSGHTGQEHDHSAANLSQHFRRLRLRGGSGWEELPMQTPLQGLALVAHGGKLYRVGGMNARNATTNEEEDVHSTTEFAAFDPATNQWTALAPLPAPRSSHNGVVIGDRLYVAGGWTLSGPRAGQWLDDSLIYDFADTSAGWQQLPKPSFQRRALAAGQWQGRLVALGGMDEHRKVSQRVDLFNPQTGKWSRGPDLPGKGMAGFGVSAWNLDGNLYVCGYRGRVYRLSDEGSSWEEVARLAKPRFFHQLVPAGTDDALLVVGGASRKGHLADVERIEVGPDAVKESAAETDSGRAANVRPQPSAPAGM